MAKGNHDNLAVTKGQRARYIGAMVMMARGLCMFGARRGEIRNRRRRRQRRVERRRCRWTAEWLTSVLHESFGSAMLSCGICGCRLFAIAITGVGGLFFFLRGVGGSCVGSDRAAVARNVPASATCARAIRRCRHRRPRATLQFRRRDARISVERHRRNRPQHSARPHGDADSPVLVRVTRASLCLIPFIGLFATSSFRR